ncbi:MAG: hypothetical protein Q9219_003020 [cf. Caloplaca sp. 3 TL-2023]
MSIFTALNIEPESDSEDEFDNTKEIQIEEALKLYQNALKLHSQGPSSFDEAEEAYGALFRSEIFTYLESLSETQRIEYYSDAPDDVINSSDQVALESVAADGTPSTLPQILYLSYKNHGYLILDRLKSLLQTGSEQGIVKPTSILEPKEVSKEILSSLALLVEALERDDSDIELWRQVSRIGESLGSTRIARFCLEAILDKDQETGDAWPEPLGLQDLFAAERLKILLGELSDDLSQASTVVLTRKQKGIVQSFKSHLDPLPYLPTPPPEFSTPLFSDVRQDGAANLRSISVPVRSWASCGKAILLQISQESQGLGDCSPGVKYVLELPSSSFPSANERHTGADTPSKVLKNVSSDATHNPGSSQIRVDSGEPSSPHQNGAEEAGNSPRELASTSKLSAETVPIEASVIGESLMEGLESTDHHLTTAVTTNTGLHNADSHQDQSREITLPTRKRSTEAADLEDGEDAGRSRSKRIKARASIDEPTSRREAAAKQQLKLYQQGELQYFNLLDEQAFEESAKLLSTFGVLIPSSVKERRASIVALARALKDGGVEPSDQSPDRSTVLSDLSISLLKWSSDLSTMFLHGGGIEDPISGVGAARNSGLLVFLEQSGVQARDCASKPTLTDDQGLAALVQKVRSTDMNLDQVALAWIEALLSCAGFLQASDEDLALSAYEGFLWPDDLKEVVVQVLVKHDGFIYQRLFEEIVSHTTCTSNLAGSPENLAYHRHKLVQNIFELHLDIYWRITNPSSEVDVPIRTAQSDRLRRWATLAYHVQGNIEDNDVGNSKIDDTLSIRFLWAYAVLANLCEDCSRELVILYFQDLKSTLEKLGNPVLELLNNAAIPEISVVAAEKQISRLTTMDFFVSVFNPNDDDPVALIESLEPVLEKSIQKSEANTSLVEPVMFDGAGDAAADQLQENQQRRPSPPNEVGPHTDRMLQFLEKASLSMRLMLWRRLLDAYSIIQYSPRILLCYLRCIILIVRYLNSAQYFERSKSDRQPLLLRWFKSIDDLLAWSLALAWSDAQSLDCMDEGNLRDTMSALSSLQCMLHSVIVVDDLVRIGISEPPDLPTSSANTAYNNSMSKFRDMAVRTWTLQYILLRDGTVPTSSANPSTYANLFHYLTSIHRMFGPRNYCKVADKTFLKLARRELLTIGNYDESEIEGAQIILDFYGMKICPGSKEVEDHGCPAETLYRSDAVGIIDRVLVQAQKLNIKDLIKSELRSALDKMQQAIRVPKNTAPVLHNRRILDRLLRSPIHPINLYRAMQGIGELHFQNAHGETYLIAEKGWYFLQGHVALAKFRSQKRTSPGGSDELDIALKFFQHDLEQGYEKWETWYRLAQVYDAKLEEATIWTAEKLNDSMEDVTSLQRSAIHCYTMAIATAERCEDPTLDMFQKVADLYSDFGIRMYASSREPFSMEALGVEKFKKHFNGTHEGKVGTYQGEPFKPIGLYSTWRFASGLLRRALALKSDNWINQVLSGHNRISFEPAVDAIKAAIESLPERRDSKHPEKDPILEPHYKLVSMVHKLVSSEWISAENGCETLSATSYARTIPCVQDFDDWEGYILQVLKKLRGADRSNWHHRMVLRSARTIYQGSPNIPMATLATKHELTQQIFTKSMTVQVWKPENERAGRHFVYTTRYVQFFLGILFELKDRNGIEMLGRQIRKKPGKFFRHHNLWHEMCLTHLKLLRTQCLHPAEISDSVFKNISHDVFVQNADRLEAWAHLPTTDLPVLDILKEAIELKKTNANLMKPAVIEDFIADAYAHLHLTIVPELIAKSNEEESRGRMRVDHLMNTENQPTSTPSPGPAGNLEDATPARQRIRGVGRRELQKRAEALVNKPAAAQIPVKNTKTPPPVNGPQTPRSSIQVVIKHNSPVKENSSVPGSVHDSADDESELSEVSATSKPRPLFPNLGDTKEPAEDEDREGSEEEVERVDDEQADGGAEEDEPGDGGPLEDEQEEAEGEEIYHTPMEM